MTIFLQACADNRQCKRLRSIYGSLLKGHVFQEHNAANILACSLLCNSNIRCQSINYVISRHLCELNSRTKEARPEDYVQDADRVYLTRPSERGIKSKMSVLIEIRRESSKCGHSICFFACIFFASCVLCFSCTSDEPVKRGTRTCESQDPLRTQKFI